MKLIPLTQGKFAKVDDADFDYLNQWKWFSSKIRHTSYAMRKGRGAEPGTVYMHRLLLKAPKGTLVDHANGDGLCNTRENIRLCTPSQNTANSRRSLPSSGFRGVCSEAKGKKPWSAWITVNGKLRRIGTYKTKKEAAESYDIAALEAFGPFARLNGTR